jgi:hypothetical protein
LDFCNTFREASQVKFALYHKGRYEGESAGRFALACAASVVDVKSKGESELRKERKRKIMSYKKIREKWGIKDGSKDGKTF